MKKPTSSCTVLNYQLAFGDNLGQKDHKLLLPMTAPPKCKSPASKLAGIEAPMLLLIRERHYLGSEVVPYDFAQAAAESAASRGGVSRAFATTGSLLRNKIWTRSHYCRWLPNADSSSVVAVQEQFAA